MAVYGRAPNWVYGALVMQTGTQPFYQFDSRLGWVAPPLLQISNTDTQSSPELRVWLDEHQDATVLKMNIVTKYLDYIEAEHLSFPPVPTGRGLILSGAVPHWLLTALVRLYNGTGVAWIACHQPQLDGAVIVFSCTEDYAPGDLISLAIS